LHDMTGGSTWLPGLLGTLYPGEVNETALQAGIDRARYMLQNAAELDVVQEGGQLKVTITNNTGHKLPTGYPEGRRMWINVQFYDSGMTLISESAAYDPTTGVLGHDAEAKIYHIEPGLDEVTAPLVGVDPGPSFHFVLNNKVFLDNRIPPRGFTNAEYADFGGAPVGHSYADGQYWDDTYYAIPPGAATAEVTLYYQGTSREFIEFLRDENTTDSQGQNLYDLWNNNDKCPPEMMESETLVLAQCTVDADCDDGEYCNGLETCNTGDGTCQPGTPVDCNDGFDCTIDFCNETTDSCDNVPDDGFCDNGQFCDGSETCVPTDPGSGPDGCLAGTAPDCTDAYACTDDSCDPAANGGAGACVSTPNDSFCDNGQFCDGAETCVPADPGAGVDGCLAGTAPDCTDAYDCTHDSCDPAANGATGACVNTPNDLLCDNGQFCDGAETCVPTDPGAGADGCLAGSDPCPNTNCDEANDVCTDCLNDEDCDDGQFCNGVETCDTGNGVCIPGTAPDCSDAFACTDDSCDPQANGGVGACVNVPNHSFCDNADVCDGTETCVPTDPGAGADGCLEGTAPSCDDNNVCTADSCDPVAGCINDGTGITIPCDDGDEATVDDVCQGDAAGTCLGVSSVEAPGPAPYPHNRVKNRYLSFVPNNVGRAVAFKVELLSLEQGSCSGNGAPCRVDRGGNDCNACAVSGAPCISSQDCQPTTQSCDPTGEVCLNDLSASAGMTWWVGPDSPLGNAVHLLVSETYRVVASDWPAVVHLGDCEVVPRATYGVRAVDVATGAESAQLAVSTAGRPGANYWADCVGPLDQYCTGNWAPCPNGDADCPLGETCLWQWGLPDLSTNFDDVTALIFLFQSTPGKTVPEVPWVDIHGNDSGLPGSENFDPPNYVANFSDVQFIVLAFQGRPYPFDDPADCPDVGAWP